MKFTRRDVIRTGAAAAAGVVGSKLIGSPAFAQSAPTYTPEAGATLRVLRWSPFVQADEDQWIANTKRFTDATGVQVRIDKESWEDIRPKAAVAANVGSGPDIMWVWFDDAHQYPDKLLDVTDLADYLGNKYGGWYEGGKGYATKDGKFIGLPLAAIGNAIVYRDSWVKEAGFSEFPKDTAGFLELCKAMQKIGHPAGFTHGHGVGDGNNYAHWLLWSHGGRMVDEGGKVVINGPETMKAIEYAQELYKTFIPGTESWLDVNNNRAFLAGELGVIANGISAYRTAQDQQGQRSEAHRDRQGHPHHKPADRPGRPVGRAAPDDHGGDLQLHALSERGEGLSPVHVRERADERLDREVRGLLLPVAQGLCGQPGLEVRSQRRAYSKASETLRPNGYAGPLGYASAATMADYVLVDMFAKAVTGQATPQEAMEEAEKRANRYYRV